MPLNDVRRLLDMLAHPGTDWRDADWLIDEQLARAQERIADLDILKRQLQSLRTQCPSKTSSVECGVLQELVAAAQGDGCVRRPSESDRRGRKKNNPLSLPVCVSQLMLVRLHRTGMPPTCRNLGVLPSRLDPPILRPPFRTHCQLLQAIRCWASENTLPPRSCCAWLVFRLPGHSIRMAWMLRTRNALAMCQTPHHIPTSTAIAMIIAATAMPTWSGSINQCVKPCRKHIAHRKPCCPATFLSVEQAPRP